MKFSCFYIMTAPEKMGFPYIQSLISSLNIFDEVVVVIGRDEAESDRKIENLQKFLENDRRDFIDSTLPGDTRRELKIVRTHAWPEAAWHYNTMRDHLQIGLDACTGDYCVKIDADHIFRDQYTDEIRDTIHTFIQNRYYVPINLIHFYKHHVMSFRAIMERDMSNCYVVNKKRLKQHGASCRIINESGSNKPVFFDKHGHELGVIPKELIGDLNTRHVDISSFLLFLKKVCPINYSYTFCNKRQISINWSRCSRAKALKFQTEQQFDYDDLGASFKNFMNYYHTRKIPKRILSVSNGEPTKLFGTKKYTKRTPYSFTNNGIFYMPQDEISEPNFMFPITAHAPPMQEKIMTIDRTMWGYDNFQDEWDSMNLQS